MIKYLLALAAFGPACLAYLILAFGARFNRTDELPSDGDTQDAIRERIKRERADHHGSPNYISEQQDHG